MTKKLNFMGDNQEIIRRFEYYDNTISKLQENVAVLYDQNKIVMVYMELLVEILVENDITTKDEFAGKFQKLLANLKEKMEEMKNNNHEGFYETLLKESDFYAEC